MKYTHKLWKKFLNKRIYGWDLIYIKDSPERKIIRFVDGVVSDEFRGEYNEQISIPEKPDSVMLQVWSHLYKNRFNDTYCFLKARELVGKYPKLYKLTFSYKLKELR